MNDSNNQVDSNILPSEENISPDGFFKNFPLFNIESEYEFNSFKRGIKTYRFWKEHTKSEKIRQWANKNPYKSFYVCYKDCYILVNRNKDIRDLFK